MPENSIYTTTAMIGASMLNEYGCITPAACQRLFVSAMEMHLKELNLDVPYLLANYGISWVMLALTGEIRSRIVPGEILTVKTWCTYHEGVLYRREFAAYHANGILAIAGAGFFTIIDLHSRKICRTGTPADVLSNIRGEELLTAKSRFKPSMENPQKVFEYPIISSWIDQLGHVNNVRYGDFVYDVLPEEKHRQMNLLQRFEIYFTGELRKGDTVQVHRTENKSVTEVVGFRSSDGRCAFSAKLIFSAH